MLYIATICGGQAIGMIARGSVRDGCYDQTCTLDRYLLRRNVPINIIPVQQYDIMEDFKLWVPDATIQELYKFWHAHNREVNAWSLAP